nr:MAG TPA: hypothetical protein [Caudoviricetes sp.]
MLSNYVCIPFIHTSNLKFFNNIPFRTKLKCD